MEASGQSSQPARMPSAAGADALGEILRSLKEIKLGDPPEQVWATLRESLQGLKDIELGDSPAEVAATLRASLQGLKDRLPAGPGAAGAAGAPDPAGAPVSTPPFEERPELYVGAAFAGGLALAGLLRLLGR